MKHVLFYPILGALLSFGSATHAQVSFGPRLGVSRPYFAYEWHGYGQTMDPKLMLGGQLGVTLNAQFGKWAVQPSLLYAVKGDRRIEQRDVLMMLRYETEHTFRYNYIELPVQVVFSTKGARGGLQVFAGPYIAYGLHGKYQTKDTWLTQLAETGTYSIETNVKFATRHYDIGRSYAHRLDAGLTVGLGYKVGSLQAQLGYGLGLHNLLPKSPSGKDPLIEQYNRSLQLSLAYFFEMH